MRRRICTLASAVSLILSIAIIVPWSRSHERGYRAYAARKNSWLVAMESQEGRFRVAVVRQWPFDLRFQSEQTAYNYSMGFGVTNGGIFHASYTHDAWLIEGYGYSSAATIDAFDTSPTYFLPLRFIVLRYRGIFAVLLALPILWLISWMWRITYHDLHPARADRCPTCNYNLTGNISGTCPECGTAVANKAGA